MCELLKPTKNYLRLENTTKLVYICHASLRNKVCFFVSLLWLMSFLYVQILKVVQCYRSSKQNNMYKTHVWSPPTDHCPMTVCVLACQTQGWLGSPSCGRTQWPSSHQMECTHVWMGDRLPVNHKKNRKNMINIQTLCQLDFINGSWVLWPNYLD